MAADGRSPPACRSGSRTRSTSWSSACGVEREAGYQRIKIKIKRGWDVEAVERVRKAFGDIPLMVDANAAYTRADAGHLATLDQFDLMMIEQPLDYDDWLDHAALQAWIRTPICLDESITSPRDRRTGDRGGRVPHREHQARPRRRPRRNRFACTMSAPRTRCRSGTAACSNRASAAPTTCILSTLPNFRLPGDIAASRRYYAEDLIDPAIDVNTDGTVTVPDRGPGIGVEIVPERVDRATLRRTEIRTS